MKFFKESIKSIKTSGSIAPSSKYLIEKCLAHVDFTKAKIILEFGVGDGVITAEILERVSSDCKVIAIEINENLYDYTKEKFSNNQLELVLGSAFDFDKILKERETEKVDYIISSLPLSLLEEREVNRLFVKLPNYISESGAYIQYQYSLGKYAYLKKVFKDVKVDFTIMNTPPALIFTCSV